MYKILIKPNFEINVKDTELKKIETAILNNNKIVYIRDTHNNTVILNLNNFIAIAEIQ